MGLDGLIWALSEPMLGLGQHMEDLWRLVGPKGS